MSEAWCDFVVWDKFVAEEILKCCRCGEITLHITKQLNTTLAEFICDGCGFEGEAIPFATNKGGIMFFRARKPQ